MTAANGAKNHRERIAADYGVEENPSTTLLREYIRINTAQPNPDYDSCVKFLKRQAERLGLDCDVKEMVKGKPIIIMTWFGMQPDLPSLLLNSHMDVVPVDLEHWKHDPFAAVKEESGDIYGRGTQDMKSVGVQHIEAIYRLKVMENKRLKRTIHLCFTPDEENGSRDGMKLFAPSEEFKSLNVGIALDEGMASPSETIPVYYGERHGMWVKFICRGNAGHASGLIEATAAEKAQYLMNKLLSYREEQKKKLEANPALELGDVTSINLTHLSGGTQMNVVPSKIALGFDMRIPPTTDFNAFKAQLEDWCEEAGNNIEIRVLVSVENENMTSVAEDDPWYKAFKKAIEKNGLKIVPRIFPAGTDSGRIRKVGIPAYGFSPMDHTPILLHDHDEFINEKVFLKGIGIFRDIIKEIASV